MHRIFVRLASSAVIAAALFVSACGDSSSDVGADKLKDLESGAPKASVAALIGSGPLTGQFADTARVENGYRRNIYLIDGKEFEVIFYRELPGDVAEPVEQAKETPIVLSGGKVLGWGWRFYVEEAMAELKLPSPLNPQIDASTPGVNPGAIQPSSPAPAPMQDSTAKGDSAAAGPKA